MQLQVYDKYNFRLIAMFEFDGNMPDEVKIESIIADGYEVRVGDDLHVQDVDGTIEVGW